MPIPRVGTSRRSTGEPLSASSTATLHPRAAAMRRSSSAFDTAGSQAGWWRPGASSPAIARSHSCAQARVVIPFQSRSVKPVTVPRWRESQA